MPHSHVALAQLLRADQPVPKDPPWAELDRLAVYHGVMPWLWSRLRASGPPAELAATWRQAYFEAALASDWRWEALLPALDALGAAGIAPVPLKGLVLAETAYPTPALRPMGDIDLLLRREEIAPACAALRPLGWAVLEVPARKRALNPRNGGEVQLRHAATGLLLELHWWLFAGAWSEYGGLLEADPWRRLTSLELRGRTLAALHPHDHLLLLAHHLVVSNQCGEGLGRMLVDLESWVRRFPPEWPRLAAEAAALGLGRVLWLAGWLTKRNLGASWPLVSAPPLGAKVALRGLLGPAADLAADDPRRWPPRRWLLLLALFDDPRARRRFVRAVVSDPAYRL